MEPAHRDDAATAALVARVRAGDRAAYGALYSVYLPVVRRVVADNVPNRADADDVVQEVFARALRRLGSLRDDTRFRPWLLSIARRAAIDHRRARVAGRAVPTDDVGLDHPASAPEPDEQLELSEAVRALDAALVRLSPRDATALAMVGHLGLGPAEVAAALGISVGAAKVCVHRARTRLAAALAAAAASDAGRSLATPVPAHPLGGCDDREIGNRGALAASG